MFTKILIANRGEITCRVIRTCRRLGVKTVAVYSDADAKSMHVRMADEAVRIGASAPQESYLNIAKIIDAAQRTGAQAIHPGYGFLSENEEFAAACQAAGIIFIGPPPEAIHAMGSKSAAKALMQKAGVPLTPGYHGDEQAADFLLKQADKIGYPVLIKASAGGGGKGMRRVDAHADFLTELASCQREAAASFGDDHVLIEKYILRPRHIEIQVFADMHGNVVSLFERDCSVQRRHQKVLEEAPAPGMTMERREAMGKAACDAARAVGYVGAGTVEFIADASGTFHFMEMNTRLQVEHPVTEMITGLDLVEWQLRVAAGGLLPLKQNELAIKGHALEARLYAEDPSNNFLPSIGKLQHLRFPAPSVNVRIDAGVEQGDEITPFYDPMIAKLITYGPSREDALATMLQALSDVQVVGVQTNAEFLKRLVQTHSFSNADLDTGLIERERSSLFVESIDAPADVTALAALAVVETERITAEADSSPWSIRDGWRLNGTLQRTIHFLSADAHRDAIVEYSTDSYTVRVGESIFAMKGSLSADGQLIAVANDRRMQATVVAHQGTLTLFQSGTSFVYKLLDPLESISSEVAGDAGMLSPMPGLITNLLVREGIHVERGDPLLTLEAMKMEYTIKAPAAGTVQALFYAKGDQVSEGVQLLQFLVDGKKEQ